MPFDIANRPPRSTRPFPSRTRPYGAVADFPDFSPQSGALYRFVLGIDTQPQLFDREKALTELGDPLAQLVLLRGKAPMTLDALLRDIDAANSDEGGIP